MLQEVSRGKNAVCHGAEQSRAEQSRAEHSAAEQSTAQHAETDIAFGPCGKHDADADQSMPHGKVALQHATFTVNTHMFKMGQ